MGLIHANTAAYTNL